jgi:hypothetical protein
LYWQWQQGARRWPESAQLLHKHITPPLINVFSYEDDLLYFTKQAIRRWPEGAQLLCVSFRVCGLGFRVQGFGGSRNEGLEIRC